MRVFQIIALLVYLCIHIAGAINNPQNDFMDRFDIVKNHVNIRWTSSGSLGDGDLKYEIDDEYNGTSNLSTPENLGTCPNHEKSGISKGSCPDYGKTFVMDLQTDEYNEDFLNEISFGFLNKKFKIAVEIPVEKSGMAMYQGLFKSCPYDRSHSLIIRKENEYNMCFSKFYDNKYISTRVKKRTLRNNYVYFSSHGLGGRFGSNTEYPFHNYDPEENYVTKRMRYPNLIKNLSDCSIYSHCIGPCLDKDFDNKCFLNLPVVFNHKTKECVILGTHEEYRKRNCISNNSDGYEKCFLPIKKEEGKEWTYASSFLRPDYHTKCPPRYPLNDTEFGYFKDSTGECESSTKYHDNNRITFKGCIEELFHYSEGNDNTRKTKFLWGVWRLEDGAKTVTSMDDFGLCFILKERPTCVIKRKNNYSFTNLTANSFDHSQIINYPDVKRSQKNEEGIILSRETVTDNIEKGTSISERDNKKERETEKNISMELKRTTNHQPRKDVQENINGTSGIYINNGNTISYLQKMYTPLYQNKFNIFSDNMYKPLHKVREPTETQSNLLFNKRAHSGVKSEYKYAHNLRDSDKTNFLYKSHTNVLLMKNPQAKFMERFDILKNHVYIDWKKDGKYGKGDFKYDIISDDTAGTSESLLINDFADICPNHVVPGRAHGSCPNYGKAIIVQTLVNEEEDINFNLNFLNEIHTGYLNRKARSNVELPYNKSGIAMHHGFSTSCPLNHLDGRFYEKKTDYNYNMCKSKTLSSTIIMKDYDMDRNLYTYYGLYGLGGRLVSNIPRLRQKHKFYEDNISLPMKNPSLIRNLFDCSLYSYCVGPCIEDTYKNKCFRNLPAYYNHTTNECVILGTHEQERTENCRKDKEDLSRPNCQKLRKTIHSKDWTYVSSFVRPDYEEKCPPRFPLKSKIFGIYDEKTGKCESLMKEYYKVNIKAFPSCLEYLFISSPKNEYSNRKKDFWGIWVSNIPINTDNYRYTSGTCYHIPVKPTCVIHREHHFSFTALTANTIDFDQNFNIVNVDELIIKHESEELINQENNLNEVKQADDGSNSFNAKSSNYETQFQGEKKLRANEEKRKEEEAMINEEIKKVQDAKKIKEERKADEVRKKEEARKAEDERKKEEERKAAEAKKKEESRKAAEAKKKEEERKAAEVKKKEEERKAAEAKKKEESRKAAEAKKKEEERKAAEVKKKEEERKAAEVKKKKKQERLLRQEKKKNREKLQRQRKKKKQERLQRQRKKKRRERLQKLKKKEEARKAAEAKKKEEDRKAAEAKKKEEERKAAELKKKEEARKAAEAKKKEEDRKAAEAKKKEEERKAAELKKKEEARKAAEAKKKEEDRKAAEAKKKEEERKAAELKKKKRQERLLRQRKKKRIEKLQRQRKRRGEKGCRVKKRRADRKSCRGKEKRRGEKGCRVKEKEEARKAAEAKKKEEERKAAEVKKKEEARKAAEAKKKEEARKASEAKKKEEERKVAEARKKEEERKAAEGKEKEEERKAAEARKKEEERKAAEAKKKEEERKAAEAKKKEEERKDEEARKIIELKKGEIERNDDIKKKIMFDDGIIRNALGQNENLILKDDKKNLDSQIKGDVDSSSTSSSESKDFKKHNFNSINRSNYEENSQNNSNSEIYNKEHFEEGVKEDKIRTEIEDNGFGIETTNKSYLPSNNNNNYEKSSVDEYKFRDVIKTREEIINSSKNNTCSNVVSSKYCDFMKDSISSGTCSNEERKYLCCSISDYCLKFFDYNSNKYYDCTKKEFDDPSYKCFKKGDFSNMAYFAGAGIILMLLFVIGSKIILGKWFEEATFDEFEGNYDKVYTLAMISKEQIQESNPLDYSECVSDK
ncbi:merozoite adhesive erythrocytic binding protein, putative [Plasmodium malariae]|uniref:Erythrocyte-binding protein n=1 Tax=Plasmodium malariae TaxID=5858 RepID=A0A1D3PCJ4_PLAMA|nr:merozoite adhesive erythrocytic binding protein, putative [Plasmodium malariae]SCN12991.1 merozoite adhesive erythrocytic binding protein, putative [Plasmodium malariae]